MTRSARREPRFFRPVDRSNALMPFAVEAERLRVFSPPFRFTRFFSPEDSLLCVCASDAAVRKKAGQHLKIAELTTGSGLVGMSLVLGNKANSLLGLDVDASAIATAAANAETLHIEDRCRFACADLWSRATLDYLLAEKCDLIICNPPYVPEPVGEKLQVEAGAGADGTAHLLRTIELLACAKPESAVLSWCSLSNPRKVIDEAHRAGYALEEVFAGAIADGEYSGSVQPYLRSLPHAYICERPVTLQQIAPDGSARFSYLLMSGVFSRRASDSFSAQIEKWCSDFSRRGIEALTDSAPAIPSYCWMLDRWDELALRAELH